MDTPAIVITDHDRDFLEMMEQVLVEEGYPGVFCVLGDQAWETIEREGPGLIIINISLRDPESGWELLSRLRLHRPTAEIPVILTSTDPTLAEQKAEHLARMRCQVLEKPFLVEDLLAKVRAAIGPPPERERTA